MKCPVKVFLNYRVSLLGIMCEWWVCLVVNKTDRGVTDVPLSNNGLSCIVVLLVLSDFSFFFPPDDGKWRTSGFRSNCLI